jgi:MFS family permease
MSAIESLASPIDAGASLPSAERRRIFLYLGGLILLVTLNNPNGGLLDVPITFLLKNRLHWNADNLAWFRLVASLPLYLAFVFGLARDNLVAVGFTDRRLIGTFGLVGLILHAIFAVLPVTVATLFSAVLLLTTSALFIAAAQNGLASTLGGQHSMSGQVSAVWSMFNTVPSILAPLAGGWLSDKLDRLGDAQAARVLFGTGGAVSLLLLLYAALRPASVYGNVALEHEAAIDPWADLKRLARHRPVYPALLIWLVWNFAPGSITPLQYHLQNTLGATDAQWGAWNAIFSASFVPTYFLYGVLCSRYPLKRLLLWGTVAAVPQFTPLLFIHSTDTALLAAAPIGLMGGFGEAAYLDLLIRSCPPGLQGTMIMMSSGLFFVSARFGDVLGTALYDRSGGFTSCVVTMVIAYVLILPILRWIPAELVAGSDSKGRTL